MPQRRNRYGKPQEKTIRKIAMEVLCSISFEPESCDRNDLCYDFNLNDRLLERVINQLQLDHRITVMSTTSGRLFIPQRSKATARRLADNYWEKTYGEENVETKKAENCKKHNEPGNFPFALD